MLLSEPRVLTIGAICLRILTAIVIGGIIGMERGIKNRPAGLRTYMLVTVGAAAVMMMNQYIYQVYHTGDPVRMGAQVISGIGFLGAGTIVVTSHNHIMGLTTAAGLWASACIGLAIGVGLYEVAVIGGLAIYIVLALMHRLDFRLRRKAKEIEIYVELGNEMSIGKFLRCMREHELEVSNLQKDLDPNLNTEIIPWIMTVRGKHLMYQEELEKTVRQIESVKYLEIL